MSTKPFHLAVLNTHPIQYFAPLYKHLNADPEFRVTALYLTDVSLRGGIDPGFGREVTWDVDLLAGYQSVFLGGDRARRRTPKGFFSLVAPELWTHIRKGNFDAIVVHGHNYLANIIAIVAAKSIRIPVFIRGDTHLGKKRSRTKILLRQVLMPLFYKLIDVALATGTRNSEYYSEMGVPDNKIAVLPFSIDNDRFMSRSRMSADKRRAERRRWGIPPNGPAILFAAKLVAQKRPFDLLAATQRVAKTTRTPFHLVMCGSGSSEAELRAYCEENALTNVIFTGFVNQSDLPRLYGACDVFVLPADNEAWGLAVNEAMCAEMPLIVSREVGCVPDLVEEGVNGFTPSAGDIEALEAALAKLIDDKDLRTRFGRASALRIATWSYSECLENLRSIPIVAERMSRAQRAVVPARGHSEQPQP